MFFDHSRIGFKKHTVKYPSDLKKIVKWEILKIKNISYQNLEDRAKTMLGVKCIVLKAYIGK